MRPFKQVDVFTDTAYRGNPVAVVVDADGLSTEEMQRFANWTNLSETTFVLPPTTGDADYRVRIFTPTLELPFAGHPTLGTCHAWLEAGGTDPEQVVQECGAGLITLRRIDGRLAFSAPPRVKDGPLDEATLGQATRALGIEIGDVVDSRWADNGPGWLALLLESPEAVLAVEPNFSELDIGIAALHPDGSPEIRTFFPTDRAYVEDPVTGSFNASLAQWLLETGRAEAPYVARQGTAIGREGRIHVSQDADGAVWVGGGTVTCVSGEVDL
jgi:PhzF family phenazine biosynthesis protein